MNQQTTAPPSCRACGHVALITITQGQRVERYDRYDRPSYLQKLDYSRPQQTMFDENEDGIGCFCGE